jgi:hypothetical protein
MSPERVGDTDRHEAPSLTHQSDTCPPVWRYFPYILKLKELPTRVSRISLGCRPEPGSVACKCESQQIRLCRSISYRHVS